jgi:hypothetical protein
MDDAAASTDTITFADTADTASANMKLRDSTKDSKLDATLDSEWEMLAKDGWVGKGRRHSKRGRASKYDSEDADDADSSHGPHKHAGPPGPAGPPGECEWPGGDSLVSQPVGAFGPGAEPGEEVWFERIVLQLFGGCIWCLEVVQSARH